jgi:hypothetical protein
MLILLAIFLLLLIPSAMLILYLARPKFGIQWLLAVLGVLVVWPMVLLARTNTPQLIALFSWKPETLFPLSPALLIDGISWPFALALVTLALSLMLTSVAQLGRSTGIVPSQAPPAEIIEVPGEADSSVGINPEENPRIIEEDPASNWPSWAGILILTSLGLVAVTAGNLLTLLLAWAALDIFELVILLGQVLQSSIRERIVLAFSARVAGIATLLLAGIVLWSKGGLLTFDAISPQVSLYLVLAAGLRLGILPLLLPFIQELPLRRGLGTALRLIPASASLILLARVSTVGVSGEAIPLLLGLSALAGLFSARNWLVAPNELSGRPYWILGTASLAIAAAILAHPGASLAWGIASLFSGGLVFSASLRHRNLIPIFALALLNISALPFSPTWQGTSLYQFAPPIAPTINPILSYLFELSFLITQSIMLAGFLRHSLRGLVPVSNEPSPRVERWVWLLYPIGLVILPIAHLLIGWWLRPAVKEISLSGWIMGAVALGISALFWYLSLRNPSSLTLSRFTGATSRWSNLFSLDWLYRSLWGLFRIISRLIVVISIILEGEGGILWALVLLALIFVFLQR